MNRLCIAYFFITHFFLIQILDAEILTLKKKVKDLFDANRREEAVEVIKDALITADYGETSEQIKLLLLQYLAWGGNYDEALQGINLVLKQTPDNPDILFLKAKILTWKKDYKEAEVVYQKIRSKNLGSEEIEYSYAMLLLNFDKPKNAVAICKALTLVREECGQKVLDALLEKGNVREAQLLQKEFPGLKITNFLALYQFSVSYDYALVKNNENIATIASQLGYTPNLQWSTSFAAGFATRHEDKDGFIKPEIAFSPTSRIHMTTLTSYSWSHQFTPHVRLTNDMEIDLFKNSAAILGFQYLRFDVEDERDSGNIFVPSAGGGYYFLPWLRLLYRVYFSYELTERWADTHLIKVQMPFSRNLSLNAGASLGSESYNISSLYEVGTVTDHTLFAHGHWFFLPTLGVNFAASYSQRSNGFDVLDLQLGSLFRF